MSRATRPARPRARWGIALLLALVAAMVLSTFSPLAAAEEEADGPSSGDEVTALAAVEPNNPPLNEACGLKIVLVIDRSASTADDEEDYTDAANAFVDALVGTPSDIGVVWFSDDGHDATNGYVNVLAGAGTLTGTINGLPVEAFTNWSDPLDIVDASYSDADLAIFITDGTPNRPNGPGDDPLALGIASADAVKGNGTHITGVALPGDANIGNINLLVGFNEGNGLSANDPDVVSSTTDTLLDTLRAAAEAICGGSVTIHKSVRTGPATTVDGPGWSFTSTNAETTPLVTDSDGLANFTFAEADGSSETFTESLSGHAGYSMQSVACTKQGGAAVPASGITTNSFAIPVGQSDIINCEVVNTPALGSITVAKETTNGVGGPFGFNVSGPNGTDEDLTATTSQVANPVVADILSGLYPGAYTIVETDLPDGTTLDDIDCGDISTEPVENGVEVALAAGQNVTCTFTNDDPVDLSILKTSSGDPVTGATQMTYTLQVTNNGPGENADPIVVTDTLPTGLGFVSASGEGWDCSNVGSDITCTHDAQLPVGASTSITVVTTINPATVQATVQNCATVSSTPVVEAADTVEGDANDTSCVSNDMTAVLAGTGGQGPAAAAAGIAFTGSSPLRTVAIGGTMLLLGLLGLLFARRRQAMTIE